MQEIDRKVHQLKTEIRLSVNKSGLALSVVDSILQAVRAEIVQIELTNANEEILGLEKKVDELATPPVEGEPGTASSEG